MNTLEIVILLFIFLIMFFLLKYLGKLVYKLYPTLLYYFLPKSKKPYKSYNKRY